MARRYWLETLGCPKNQVDSEKLAGTLAADGYDPAAAPEDADVLVVNTCAFIEAARQESIDTVLALADRRRAGSRLVLTGCMAERYGAELATALPEVDLVAGFGVPLTSGSGLGFGADPGAAGTPDHSPGPGVPVALGASRSRRAAHPDQPSAAPQPPEGFDLLELPRPPAAAPWAYVKVAEGCDRICGFCAIPSFRGRQRSRRSADVLAEVEALAAGDGTHPPVSEIVLVAQDLASYGRDRRNRSATRHADDQSGAGGRGGDPPGTGRQPADGASPIVDLVRAVGARVPWTRLLYLYPSQLTDELIAAVLDTGVPYFDLSLQHVSRPLLVGMRRWGDGERFLARIAEIRRAAPDATFRSSFILGYPGETEEDHDALLAFLDEAQLDWAGFFPFSREEGTHAAGLEDQVPESLALERLRECAELQDGITAAKRDALVGRRLSVLVDAAGVARSVHEAPEIDGVVRVPPELPVGAFADVVVTGAVGTDLVAEPALLGLDAAP